MRLIVVFFFATLPLLLTPNTAKAEYRAFLLAIGDPQNAAGAKTVVTTLDDLQYSTYHHVKPSDKIWIQETWMCWKRSDEFAKICPNPHPGGQASGTNQAVGKTSTSPSTSSATATRAPAASH